MSSAICAVNFAYGDGTTKSYSLGPFAVNSAAALQFKNRLQNFNTVDATEQKKIYKFGRLFGFGERSGIYRNKNCDDNSFASYKNL